MAANFRPVDPVVANKIPSTTTYYGGGNPQGYADPDRNNVDTSSQYIALYKVFKTTLDNNHHYFGGFSHYTLTERMKISADALLNYAPDTITLQVTHEGALFYTLVKDNYAIYLQYFPVDQYDGSGEAQVSIFAGDENLFNFDGTLPGALKLISNYVVPLNNTLLEFA